MIDLAGSEKASAEEERRKEGSFINKSLLTLGNVVSKLSEGFASIMNRKLARANVASRMHGYVPYRDSKLTRLLKPSLEGRARVAIICTISPAGENSDETHGTLKFAERAKKIETRPNKTRILDDKALLEKYRQEIEELRTLLAHTTLKSTDVAEVVQLKEEKKKVCQLPWVASRIG